MIKVTVRRKSAAPKPTPTQYKLMDMHLGLTCAIHDLEKAFLHPGCKAAPDTEDILACLNHVRQVCRSLMAEEQT